ncbi:LacI family DNA-binding transcriptional regulator [Pseudactinotalea sp. HY158]|uniref:LacI family DNA-binding transcriptional regulator n=1 Tax=Pseudactinotalea sp. HY158 TaxID=2654547 RepID=UPI00129C940F|nr:substrate-binding domain-containing protein [Pseudactinotalea sp. HY158]QGH69048.1 LacI family DNA-binding transcriptional regulator [Pseudactinotalea sp. HY158]
MVAPRVTVATVAAAAGVSRQTVSNTLNCPQVVRPDTRDRVLAAVEQLDYHPSLAARQLKTGRSRVFGYGLRTTRASSPDPIGDRFIHALASAAQAHGYRILLFATVDDLDEIAHYRKLRLQADLDGFAVTNTHRDDPRGNWLSKSSTPYVTFGRAWSDAASPHPWVDVDGAAGVALAVGHLWELGHRRIGFLGWPQGSGVGDDRFHGWRDALLARGVQPGEASPWHRACENATDAATAAARDLLSAVTAVVCVSDIVALGAMTARSELGLSTSIVGFDDSPVAHAIGLTSIAQPLTRVADAVLERLIHPTMPNALIEPSLTRRSSTSPVQSGG